MTKINQEDLNKKLYAAADSTRVQLDGGVYKDYVLTILFLKYLSDLSKKQYKKYQERFGNDKTRIEEKMKLDRFYLPENSSFDDIYDIQEQDNIGEEINKVLHNIEEANSNKLEGVFQADFNSDAILGKKEQRNKMIRHLLHDFHDIDLAEIDEDVIGNSYMYMIEKFGTDAGKKAGEFFTKKSVAKLLARLASPKEGDRICDPCIGSGGLLLLAGEEVEKQGSKNYMLYGQESTGSTYQLARMNMFLHGKDSARLEWGDTLNGPLLVENDKLMKFDIVVSNPPFSLKKWGIENAEGDKYNRFFRGVPPKDKGDFAFISHMVETAKPKTGRVAVIVPHGVLFRGGAEGRIRQALLEENIIDAVIGLPAGLFQTTGIPVAILIIDRSREVGGKNENKKDILFIESSKEFTTGKAQNILEEKHADKIVDTYEKRKEIEKFSRLVDLKEIKENDYNLNITRYVDTFIEEVPVDIQATLEEIKKIDPELQKLEKEMQSYLKQLNIIK
ncbi:MAG: type I restriction-modification system subunit M [Candidatus Magasanikbacteria bacterium CG10_big_fil_rev_8_21_14_0_10_36_16]|uniref:site-specific DNA-methyltransferase (adenine-specific) n=1 Tax=Candidatus Magasanikbacteria bacterium CG10_big_fil_rev_8_21_14_0_10_36_16 TaxID=1974645 RepID=A0A2H0TZH7_9BACT|nr:MAG: type I restriction-modification system subunit M [Candidatus Magasanikbacteria bacterium CG10_big_fil_rev_8_21_14_0_10_36_16]